MGKAFLKCDGKSYRIEKKSLLVMFICIWGTSPLCSLDSPTRHLYRAELFMGDRQLKTEAAWKSTTSSMTECLFLCEQQVLCGSVSYTAGSGDCSIYTLWEWDLPTAASVIEEGTIILAKIIEGDLENKAIPGRPTGQSSTHLMDVSSKAIDGEYASSGRINAECSHTDIGDRDPYWWIDLERTAVVEIVHIWNRDYCEERLGDISVEIGYNLDIMEECAHYDGPADRSEKVILPCRRRLAGRFVKISGGTPSSSCNDGPNDRYITLCKVEVYAFYL